MRTVRPPAPPSLPPSSRFCSLAFLTSLTACSPGGRSASGAATVREEARVFKTYPFGDPDPVPIFARSTMWGDGARLYPYSFFNKFSGDGRRPGVDRRHASKIPTSRWPSCPRSAAKVWGATDKIDRPGFSLHQSCHEVPGDRPARPLDLGRHRVQLRHRRPFPLHRHARRLRPPDTIPTAASAASSGHGPPLADALERDDPPAQGQGLLRDATAPGTIRRRSASPITTGPARPSRRPTI